jgi:hypothetical protein
MRAEAEARRKAEDEARKRVEEEARRRAKEEAERMAEEAARRAAEAEARLRAEEEALREQEEEARQQVAEEMRRQAQEQERLRAEAEARLRAENEVQQRADLEARIRAEVEAKLRAEEEERRALEESRRREEEDRFRTEEDQTHPARMADEWFRGEESDFQPVSVPDSAPPSQDAGASGNQNAHARAAAIANLAKHGDEESFQEISSAFDDSSAEVRAAAARALFDFQEDRAAAFTRALRDAPAERRSRIGAAIASSGLANEAIGCLTGESRDKTYDAFSLLFLMSKAGEIQPLMRAIEEHPNTEARLAVIKLLALSGQPDVLPAFRRMAVRGSLPPEVRSAVMEAIYQISSQSGEASPTA